MLIATGLMNIQLPDVEEGVDVTARKVVQLEEWKDRVGLIRDN